jgi:tRNA A37 threonylcarbamoyladenosine synthetase subunit TsaC/SUA5/YrdC
MPALAEGRVIAVPGDGGYQLAALAASPASRDALAARRAGTTSSGHEPLGVVVGRRAQAVALAPGWSREMSILTDRMWPGPLTVIVPADGNVLASPASKDPVLFLSLPASRPLRALCRAGGPLTVMALRYADGRPVSVAGEVEALFTDDEVAFVLDAGPCRGPGPTVVDCTASPPTVRHVGALPESYVDAALMMGNRRKWFARSKHRGPERG